MDPIGNKVRIKNSPETVEKGLAGKIGLVYGETTPSMMDFEIIGTPKVDYAVNVHFDDLGESYWFDAELLELLDDGQGTVITLTLDGIDKKFIKGTEGEFIEEDTPLSQKETTETKDKTKTPEKKQKWWKFFKH